MRRLAKFTLSTAIWACFLLIGATSYAERLPNGTPFQELQRQIDEINEALGMIRIVKGVVSKNGTIISGDGFTVEVIDNRFRRIIFDVPFPSPPVFLCTAGGLNSPPPFGQDNVCDFGQITANDVRVEFMDKDDEFFAIDERSDFTFIAIGPRWD